MKIINNWIDYCNKWRPGRERLELLLLQDFLYGEMSNSFYSKYATRASKFLNKLDLTKPQAKMVYDYFRPVIKKYLPSKQGELF